MQQTAHQLIAHRNNATFEALWQQTGLLRELPMITHADRTTHTMRVESAEKSAAKVYRTVVSVWLASPPSPPRHLLLRSVPTANIVFVIHISLELISDLRVTIFTGSFFGRRCESFCSMQRNFYKLCNSKLHKCITWNIIYSLLCASSLSRSLSLLPPGRDSRVLRELRFTFHKRKNRVAASFYGYYQVMHVWYMADHGWLIRSRSKYFDPHRGCVCFDCEHMTDVSAGQK